MISCWFGLPSLNASRTSHLIGSGFTCQNGIMFSGAQIFIFAFLIFPFSHILVFSFWDITGKYIHWFLSKATRNYVRHYRGHRNPSKLVRTTRTYSKCKAFISNSLFSPHHHMRVISKSKTCGFVAEASAVKLMVLPTRPSNVYQIPHTHPPVFSKMPGASSEPSSSAPSYTRSA